MAVWENRWHDTWYLLSLDRVSLLADDLWIPEPMRVAQSALRESLEPWLDAGVYSTQLASRVASVTSDVHREIGDSGLSSVRDWNAFVLKLLLPDRAAESTWRSIMLWLEQSASRTSVGDSVNSFVGELRRLDALLAEKLTALDRDRLSGWDHRISTVHRMTPADLDTLLRLNMSANHFVLAWDATCRGLSQRDLLTLFETGRSVATERGLDPISIPFPGSWKFDLVNLQPRST
jgi:hypothetical protein